MWASTGLQCCACKPRARKGRYPLAIRQPLLGSELAHPERTIPGTYHSLHHYCELSRPSLLNPILQLSKVIVIIAPPVKVAYPFILDVQGYPAQIINLFVILVSIFFDRSLFYHFSCLSTGPVLSPVEEASLAQAIQRHFARLYANAALLLIPGCSMASPGTFLLVSRDLLCVVRFFTLTYKKLTDFPQCSPPRSCAQPTRLVTHLHCPTTFIASLVYP